MTNATETTTTITDKDITKAITVDVLTTTEKALSTKLITRMNKAQKSYLDMGHAILEFSTKKLYRETRPNVR
jgi:hypothetical protein